MTEINNRIEEAEKRREIVKLLAFHALVLFARQFSKINQVEFELYLDDIEGQFCQLFPQPLGDKELREKALLRDEERKQIPKGFHYLLEYKEELDWLLRLQQDKDFAPLQPKIEEARRQERERIEALFADDATFVTFIRNKGNMMDVEECYLILKSEWLALKE